MPAICFARFPITRSGTARYQTWTIYRLMGSLYEYLSAVPDYRNRRGQRFGDGSRDIGATVRFVGRNRHSGLLQEVEATAVGGGALMDERRRKPGGSEPFDYLSRAFKCRPGSPRQGLAGMERAIPGSRRRVGSAERHGRGTDAVGAAEHETGCGRVKVAGKSYEIPAARKLRSMRLSGRKDHRHPRQAVRELTTEVFRHSTGSFASCRCRFLAGIARK